MINLEPDRYHKHHGRYILGMICLVLSLTFITITLYVFPFLVFNWHYTLPDWLANLIVWGLDRIQRRYLTSSVQAARLIFYICCLATLFVTILARYLSNKIDNDIYHVDDKKLSPATDYDVLGLFLKLFTLIVVIFIAARLFQWASSSTIG